MIAPILRKGTSGNIDGQVPTEYPNSPLVFSHTTIEIARLKTTHQYCREARHDVPGTLCTAQAST